MIKENIMIVNLKSMSIKGNHMIPKESDSIISGSNMILFLVTGTPEDGRK